MNRSSGSPGPAEPLQDVQQGDGHVAWIVVSESVLRALSGTVRPGFVHVCVVPSSNGKLPQIGAQRPTPRGTSCRVGVRRSTGGRGTAVRGNAVPVLGRSVPEVANFQIRVPPDPVPQRNAGCPTRPIPVAVLVPGCPTALPNRVRVPPRDLRRHTAGHPYPSAMPYRTRTAGTTVAQRMRSMLPFPFPVAQQRCPTGYGYRPRDLHSRGGQLQSHPYP
jgi:hypothetical protein